MKIIIKPRGKGRTEDLILLCAEAQEKGELSYIVCASQPECYRIATRASELGFNITFPLTYDEFMKKEYAARNIKNFFIDNADHFLQSLTSVVIGAITMEEVEDG